MSKVRVGDIAIINGKSLGKNIPFPQIQYLDTGSITNGIIENIQMIDCNNDTIPSRAKRMVKNNTIIYSTVRPRLRHYGILHNPQENMIVSTGFVTIDAIEEKVNPLFLYYSLIKDDVTEYIASIADTAVSSYPSINPSDIADLEIDFPSIFEQNKISEILSAIDDKISTNNHINAELESMAKTIYDYWFLQFEFPDENGKPYKSSGGKMVWNEELKRDIPEGWEVRQFNEFIKFEKGKIPDELSDVKCDKLDLPYLTIDVANNGKPQFCSLNKMVYCSGGTIMVMDGAASGDVYIGNKGAIGSTLAMISPTNSSFSDAMIYNILKSNTAVYKKANTGSTVPHANRKFIENMKIALSKNGRKQTVSLRAFQKSQRRRKSLWLFTYALCNTFYGR